ncbi:MAG TPA: hypothetical protein VFA22_11605 [Stellaceae bacterium]|nr:hypothetical protein [Stellaceae bacterium]
MRRVIHIFAALPLALGVADRAAHADFYALDGRFQCLGRPGAVCYDARPSRVAPAPAPPQRPAAAVAAPATGTAKDAPRAPDPAPFKNAAPADPILAIAARIKARAPATGDIATLRRAAAGGDLRATELLAWCTLHGIGIVRSPITAYFLYGAAAAGAVPHARENQAAIYTQVLSPEERQRILEFEATPPAARRVADVMPDPGAAPDSPGPP